MLRIGFSFAALLAAVTLSSAFVMAAPPPAATKPIDLPEVVSFNRHIRPIMSDTCFLCHGNDPKSREAGMRLDIREEALKPTKNGVIPIVPGKPDESEIILRITDSLDPMPPEDAHKALTPHQKALLTRWVEQGAVYESHWAYTPLVQPPVPAAAGSAKSSGHPIDAFVRVPLAAKNIAPSPEAPRAQLLRRLSLDLTGLPPTAEDVAAFLADKSPNAYERQVDRLLASPHHGERMAVWWLDIARYADTVGFHGDQNQRIYPYRDYVINAFNANKPFDQFTIEQLAGDLLPNPTPEQRVATGYNRLNMMTREGGAQPKEYLAKYGAERVRSVAAAWFGSTFGCAECHDHKFDPIKARDFYELQAFFADVKQWGVYADYRYTMNPDLAGFNNDYPFPPEIEVGSPYLRARQDEKEAELRAYLEAMRTTAGERGPAGEFKEWLNEARAFLTAAPDGWRQACVRAVRMKGGKPAADGEIAVNDDGVVRVAKPLARGEAVRIALRPGAGRVAAIRVQVTGESSAAMPAKNAAPFRVELSRRDGAGEPRRLAVAFADAAEKEVRYEGGADVLEIASGWKVPRLAGDSEMAGVWLLEAPEVFGATDELLVTVTGELPPALRIATSPFGALEPLDAASAVFREALAATTRSAAQQQLLLDTWLASTGRAPGALKRVHDLKAAIREFRGGRAWSMVTEAIPPMTIRVLPRGNWQDESGPVVLPATPSFLPGRLESTPERRLTRLDLARWIVSPENPVTARTVVNRLWQLYFGTGLSAVLDDLGSQGEPPSHPELLDWLAAEFRDRGWDLRHMVRLIVTSATYRQSSSLRPELREIDPANRLLASQNPRRLEAEFVRDNALFIAGVLNLRGIGGPSVKPYQPAGYYREIQFPNRDYVASTGDEQWRRGVYMHWQRSFLHPMLANFDAPARDECAAQRVVSNTPQQALTLLNDPTFVEAARLFAARVVAPDTADTVRLRHAYQIALAREPKPREVQALQAFLAKQREHYAANPAEAGKLLQTGMAPAPAGDPVELAAWTQVARAILNLHELITRY